MGFKDNPGELVSLGGEIDPTVLVSWWSTESILAWIDVGNTDSIEASLPSVGRVCVHGKKVVLGAPENNVSQMCDCFARIDLTFDEKANTEFLQDLKKTRILAGVRKGLDLKHRTTSIEARKDA